MTLLFIKAILQHDWYTLAVKLGYQALAWVFVLFACFIDLKTGITASKAHGVFKTSSYGLRMTLKKFKDYMDVFLMAFVIDVFLSIFNTQADSYSFLSIFSLPLVTIVIFIYTMATEMISVLENKRKGKADDLAIKAIREQLRKKLPEVLEIMRLSMNIAKVDDANLQVKMILDAINMSPDAVKNALLLQMLEDFGYIR